jgi:membrane protease YdiL (CAAX protease family)
VLSSIAVNEPSEQELPKLQEHSSAALPSSIEPATAEPIPPVIEQPVSPHRSVWVTCVGAFAAFGVIYLLMLVAGGELRSFAVAGLQALPFAVLAVLAYASHPEGIWGKVLTLGYWILLIGAFCLFAIVLTVAGILEFNPATGAGGRAPSFEEGLRIVGAILALMMAGGIGLVCFLPGIRRRAAKLLGMDPKSFIHATALATAVAVTLICLIPLLAVNEPPLLPFIRSQLGAGSQDSAEQIRSMLYGLVWAVPASFLAVGFPLRRTFRESRLRLALEWPTRWQLVAAVVITAGLALGIGPLHTGITALWKAQGWQVTDTEAIEMLLKGAMHPLGAVAIGVTAGLGEELVFRGVLQPRLGIVLPALMFTSVHAFQYDFDALIGVLLLGLAFGVVRKKTNTTTSALIHGGYDFALLMAAYWAGPGNG